MDNPEQPEPLPSIDPETNALMEAVFRGEIPWNERGYEILEQWTIETRRSVAQYQRFLERLEKKASQMRREFLRGKADDPPPGDSR